MFVFVVRRLASLPLVLLAVSVVIVGLLQFLPASDRAVAFVRSEQQARPEAIQGIIEQYRLDEPFPVQYGVWLREALRGNLGFSQTSSEPVLTTIRKRLPASAELALFAAVPIIVFGVWIGTLAALNRNNLIDQISRLLAILGWSLPTFVFGIWILVIFYGGLGWFGIGRVSNDVLLDIARGDFATPTGFMTVDAILNGRLDVLLDALVHLILPVTTLVVVIAAQIMRVMRGSLLDALSQDYVRTARAKGLPENAVNLKHARRNAIIPIITLSGLMIAGLLNGTVVVETIFNYRGVGQWFAVAATQFDVPAVLGFGLITAVIIVFANLVVDVLYAVVDPRIRYD